MDFRQLEYFKAVYEAQSFSKATEKLHVAQPALSMQIRRLEEELGVSLFERSHRGVLPTAFGQRLYEMSWPVLRDFAAVKRSIQEMSRSDELSGKIRCGFPSPFFREIAVEAIVEFTTRYPSVEINAVDSYSGILHQMVKSGQLEFAIGALPENDKGIVSATILEEDLVLVSGHPLTKTQLGSVSLDEAHLDIILPSELSTMQPMFNRMLVAEEIRPRRTLLVNSYLGCLEIPRRSNWCSLVPISGAFAEVERGELFVHPIRRPKLSAQWHLIHENRRPLSAAARALSQSVIHHFQQVQKRWKLAGSRRKSH